MSNDKAAATYHPARSRRAADRHVSVGDPTLRPGDRVDLVRWERGHDGWAAIVVSGAYVKRTRHNYTLELDDGREAKYPRKMWTVSLRS